MPLFDHDGGLVGGSNLLQTTLTRILFRQKLLALTVQEQMQENWCWAATTAAVQNYVFRGSSRPKAMQCEIANEEVEPGPGVSCCDEFSRDPNDPVKRMCDIEAGLTMPLFRADCHTATIPDTISFEQVVEEIDREAPVCIRVLWERGSGTGHFAVIIGYEVLDLPDGYRDVVVDDSFYGVSVQSFSTFRRHYNASPQVLDQTMAQQGLWTHTYFTRPPVAAAEASEVGV